MIPAAVQLQISIMKSVVHKTEGTTALCSFPCKWARWSGSIWHSYHQHLAREPPPSIESSMLSPGWQLAMSSEVRRQRLRSDHREASDPPAQRKWGMVGYGCLRNWWTIILADAISMKCLIILVLMTSQNYNDLCSNLTCKIRLNL